MAVERVATESGLGIMSVQASVRLGEASDGQAVTVAMTSANRIADIITAQSVLRFLDPRYPDLGASLSVETRTALGYADEAEKP